MAKTAASEGATLPRFASLANMGQGELLDRANELSVKLDALLAVTCGNSEEGFRSLNYDLQSAFMWTCSDMAAELKDCIKKLT
jgi:hypothetical protein